MTDGTETTRAFLLRGVDYGEADRIVTLLTLKKGKICALARGARKSRKRFGGALQPFALFEAAFGRKSRGTLWPIEEATLIAAHEGLSKDLRRLTAASYLIELLRESLPDAEPDEAIFAHTVESLALLTEASTEQVSPLVIAAELALFRLMGWEIGITACNACGRLVPKGRPVLFHPGRGGVICTPCGGGPLSLSAAAIAYLQSLSRLPLAEAIRAGESPLGQTKEIENAISAFMEYHLSGPLPTRAYYLSMLTS